MNICDLLIMQSDLRHTNDIKEMANYVANGGFWTKEFLKEYSLRNSLERVSPLISISRFEDGCLFVHDGNHRVCSVWLGGRSYLREDEYFITNWKYSDYLEISPQKNWFTPFNPKTHVRTADFFQFKKEAKQMFEDDPENASLWLKNNYHRYRVERKINSIMELAERFKND